LMGDKRVNRYRSGAKNPEQEVLTSKNTDGTFTVAVLDAKNMRLLSHTFPAGKQAPEVEQGSEK